jgi:hypothetical protein
MCGARSRGGLCLKCATPRPAVAADAAPSQDARTCVICLKNSPRTGFVCDPCLAPNAASIRRNLIAQGNLDAFDRGPLTAEEQATLFRVRRDQNTTGV